MRDTFRSQEMLLHNIRYYTYTVKYYTFTQKHDTKNFALKYKSLTRGSVEGCFGSKEDIHSFKPPTLDTTKFQG